MAKTKATTAKPKAEKTIKAPKKTKAVRDDVPAATDGQDYEGNEEVTIVAQEPEAAEVTVADAEISSAPVTWTPVEGAIYEFAKTGDSFLGRLESAEELTATRFSVRNHVRCTELVSVEGYEIFQVTKQEIAERLN